MGEAAEPDPGDVRIGDAERQAVVDMLSRHAGAGRLTLDEFTERSDQVLAARTRAELEAVLRDLPGGMPEAAAGIEGAGGGPAPWEPQDSDSRPPARQRKRRRFVAIMSGTTARGRWWAPRRIGAWAWWGHVLIDLRDAVITSPTVTIKARAYMGAVTVIVPEGVPAEMYGSVIMGGANNATSNKSPIQGAPQILVKTSGLWGGVSVKAKRRLTPEEKAKAQAAKEAAKELAREAIREATQRHRHSHHHRARSNPGTPSSPQRDPTQPRGELPMPSLDDLIPPIARQKMAEHNLGPQLRAWVDQLSGDPTREPSGSSATEDAKATATPGSYVQASPGTDAQPGQLASGTFTMLVTDIVGSTRMSADLGDQRWMSVLRWHNDLLRGLVTSNGGTEVKAQGDGFIFAFPSARRAILSAIEIQRKVTKDCAEQADRDIQLRVGLHTGEVMADDGDLHGQNVVMAVRIADAATPGEILVSGLTHELTASAGDIGFSEGREVVLKGMEGARRVHAVSWQ